LELSKQNMNLNDMSHRRSRQTLHTAR